jgi:putative heme iron utilization protein
MKSLLQVFVLVATVAATNLSFAAERWSTDEVAIRMGVNSWLAVWSRPTVAVNDRQVKDLYATQPSATLPALVQKASKTGGLPSAMNQPERIAVNVQGDRATTTFDLAAQRGGSIVLTWERRAGLWRIVQETLPAISSTSGQVALSESNGK